MRINVLLLLAAIMGAGCQPKPPSASPIERAWEAPPAAAPADGPNGGYATGQAGAGNADTGERSGGYAAEAGTAADAATQPAGGGRSAPVVAAVVNGEAIDQQRLVQMLIDSHGIGVLEQLILLTAARQKAAELGVTVSADDIRAAQEEALRRIASPVGEPEAMPLDRAAAERLLDDFLRLKGLSRAEWDCRMEQKAYLRKIAQAEVARMEMTEQMLRDEYALAYGERVQIRHIQVATSQAIDRAAEALATKSFAEVAREFSENPLTREKGGLMPPFTRHDGAVPPLIRETAFGMNEGEVSPPLRDGAWYHIIKLERKFPASSVGYENVDPATLRERLADRLVRQRTDELDAVLFQSARIQIRSPELDRQFRARHQK